MRKPLNAEDVIKEFDARSPGLGTNTTIQEAAHAFVRSIVELENTARRGEKTDETAYQTTLNFHLDTMEALFDDRERAETVRKHVLGAISHIENQMAGLNGAHTVVRPKAVELGTPSTMTTGLLK